ncbi:hypothetical protein L3X38_006051 [Prunus dulcis]|uniref:Protein kinase domain-containing protein n=1 Tax=Prunus dulcis TaxID=3755 RepID=A0AAD4ZRY5_PRUDU|nr:hypothetical protein L3X38_006051 [Prunus dulcis]
MPNGSLEKFIFDVNTPNKNHHLGWEALDRIALGIARGLEYLHRGCNTRILHFDIKPHNILLDENFTPKISDFGLARICNMKESIVSMACARGAFGYIAPEVFSRNFGGVSHKSDVYSYGIMLSEMVGGRRNINAEAEDTSEIYFPHWIYKRIELDEELGLPSIVNEEDKVRARKMVIVSLWCIQTDPSNRPAMKDVIDMLEGSVDCLQIPPKPYLSSPPKSPADKIECFELRRSIIITLSSAGNFSMAPVALFIFSLLTHLVVLHSTEDVKINKRCPPYYCYEMAGDIKFPFKSKTHPPECGVFTVDCSERAHPRIQLKEEGDWHENQPHSSFFPLSANFFLKLPQSKACEKCEKTRIVFSHDREGECLVDDKRKFQCFVGEKGDKLGLKLGLGKIDISEVKYIIDLI